MKKECKFARSRATHGQQTTASSMVIILDVTWYMAKKNTLCRQLIKDKLIQRDRERESKREKGEKDRERQKKREKERKRERKREKERERERKRERERLRDGI